MKIYLNNPKESWVVDRFCNEWGLYNQAITTEKIKNADIIWLISPWTWKKIKKRSLKNKKVLCTIHHIDFKKFNETEKKDFLKRDEYVDAYHAISEKTKFQLEKITEKPIFVIPFWVNQNIFFEIKDKNEIRKKYNISNKYFLIGSFQRDTEGLDLISPKLSKGPDQFIEVIKKLKKTNKNVSVLLTGKRRQYIINQLNNLGIKFYYFEMVTFEELNELYNSLDLYVVASRVEGGPQAIFECGITKTPIISTDVGFATKILPKESIFSLKKDFNPSPNIDIAYKNVQSYITPNWFSKYVELFEGLI